MLKFIIDAQLLPKLAKFLNTKGCDAIHTTFFPDGHLLQDKEIRAIAVRENRIILTKDSDFFDGYLAQGAPPQVLLLQFGNIKNEELLAYFDNEFSNIQALFDSGAELVLFDRTRLTVY
jgi:predicted nuclease of predicted toxin-antitoxin system